MTDMLPPEPPLSPHWTFVVQVRKGSGLTSEALRGRVEHLVSGQAAFFASLEELRAFMEQVLTAHGDPVSPAT